jgi:hypothetical protein
LAKLSTVLAWRDYWGNKIGKPCVFHGRQQAFAVLCLIPGPRDTGMALSSCTEDGVVKIRDKGKIVSARYQGGGGEKEGAGRGVRVGVGEGGRNDPNIVCTYE